LFLDLPALVDPLTAFVDKSSTIWSANSTNVTRAWIRDGLKPRCITRDLKWGTPVPKTGYEDKVFYVWFDAPIGYLSITANYTNQWEKWWKNPKEVELVQFMGKDNIPFHTVIFPSSLIGANDNYTMLHHISTTEYLNYESGKFSKSRGTGVFGDDALKTGLPADVWRFYLLSNRPETSDTTFQWENFANAVNSELLAKLGNLSQRLLSFITSSCGGVIPAQSELTKDDEAIIAQVKEGITLYVTELEKIEIRGLFLLVFSVSCLFPYFLCAPQMLSSR
jgi:methionyl-tRNA synthetase